MQVYLEIRFQRFHKKWNRYDFEIKVQKGILIMINKDSIEEAVANIKRLDNKKPFDNPSSNMDDCIKKIKKIK